MQGLFNISIIRDQKTIKKFLLNHKEGTSTNLANCATAIIDDPNLPRFQTIREFYAQYPGIVYNGNEIFIAGYVFDASTYSDAVKSKSLYQFHEEYQKRAKNFRRTREFFLQIHSLSMYSTKQEFAKKIKSIYRENQCLHSI